MRDEFGKSEVLTLAKRAGFHCSNPVCNAPTIGAAADQQGVINIGVAAHITAASPNGPRYEERLTPAERRSVSNGIWLCQSCAKLIDSDATHFTEGKIKTWKQDAEQASFRALSGARNAPEELLKHLSTFLSRRSNESNRLSPQIGSVLALSNSREANISQRRSSVGQLVQWGRILDGVYAPRPELLAAVMQEYFAWIATTGTAARNRLLPVFWIDGRSGDGKSVLLLQLVVSILKSRPETLIYQLARSDALPELIDYAHNAQKDDGLILIIAEDLHQITNGELFTSALKLSLDRDQFRVAVLACGPTPEREAFARVNSSIDVSSWVMPPLSPLDVSIFSEWFEIGIEPSAKLERTILVEILFASWVGMPLALFARTFGQRLKGFDVFEATCKLMAINAIDVGGPAAIFKSDHERDSVERLARADQLHFEWRDELWGSAIRFVHGAIAWKLFDEWSSDPLRGLPIVIRLARAIASVLRIGSVPTEFRTQLMVRLRGRLGTLLQLSGEELAVQKRRLFEELVRCTADNSPALAVTIDAVLADYVAEKDTSIDERYIELAARIRNDESVSSPQQVLVAARLAVLEFLGRIAEANHRDKAEAKILDPSGDLSTHEAIRMLIGRAGSAPILVERWLCAHPTADLPQALLIRSLLQIGATPALSAAVRRYILKNWDDQFPKVEPVIVLTRAAKDRESLSLALRWLNEHGPGSHVLELIVTLVRTYPGDKEVRIRALRALEAYAGKSKVLDLLGILLGLPNKTARSSLHASVLALVRGHWNSPHVGNVLPVALRVFRNDHEIMAMSMEWIQSHWVSTPVGMVLGALVKSNRDDCDVAALSLKWIESGTQNDQAAVLLSALLKGRPNDAGIRTAAIAWIHSHLMVVSIFNPIATLLSLVPEDVRVRKLAFDWVLLYPAASGVSHLLSSLINTDPEDVRVMELASDWARAHPRNSNSGQLISTLLKARPSESKIRQLALNWLSDNEGVISGGQLISTLLSVSSCDMEIEQLAKRWLESNGHRRDEQAQVLASLVGLCARSEKWIGYSISYLEANQPDKEVGYVFEALARAAPLLAPIRNLMSRYIENPKNDPGSRQLILQTWIAAGGCEGPAIDYVCQLFNTRDRYTDSGMQVFGILARASANMWAEMLQAIDADPSRSRDICYLVGYGIPSVAIDSNPLILSIRKWPADDVCYIWKGLLQSKCDLDALRVQLSAWLRTNWRKKGYGVVLEGIRDRSKMDVTFPMMLPREVSRDLRA